MESLMNAQLSKDVFSESTIDGIVVDEDNENNIDTTTTASEASKRKRGTYISKGILKFVNSTLTESNNAKEKMTTIRTATASADDKYIRQKKRVAV